MSFTERGLGCNFLGDECQGKSDKNDGRRAFARLARPTHSHYLAQMEVSLCEKSFLKLGYVMKSPLTWRATFWHPGYSGLGQFEAKESMAGQIGGIRLIRVLFRPAMPVPGDASDISLKTHTTCRKTDDYFAASSTNDEKADSFLPSNLLLSSCIPLPSSLIG
jgi:hypothetical protein